MADQRSRRDAGSIARETPDDPVVDRVKGAIFACVGVAMLIGAGAIFLAERNFLARSVTAPGVVVSEEDGPAHVRVRFTTPAGRDVTYSQGGDVFQHAGDRVRVRYDPREPDRSAALDAFGATWGAAIGVGGLGLVFTVVGAALVRGRR